MADHLTAFHGVAASVSADGTGPLETAFAQNLVISLDAWFVDQISWCARVVASQRWNLSAGKPRSTTRSR